MRSPIRGRCFASSFRATVWKPWEGELLAVVAPHRDDRVGLLVVLTLTLVEVDHGADQLVARLWTPGLGEGVESVL